MESIKILRNKQNLNQTEFGKMIGYERGTIAQIEAGRATPTTNMLVKIKEVFNVSIDSLLSNDIQNGYLTGKLNSNALQNFIAQGGSFAATAKSLTDLLYRYNNLPEGVTDKLTKEDFTGIVSLISLLNNLKP